MLSIVWAVNPRWTRGGFRVVTYCNTLILIMTAAACKGGRRCEHRNFSWRDGRMVTQRSAKPRTWVRFPLAPPISTGPNRLGLIFSTISTSQLRVIARRLGVAPGDLLREADGLAERLRMQGVEVSDEKGVHPAVIMIGLAYL